MLNALLIFFALVGAWVLGWGAGVVNMLAHIQRKYPVAFYALVLDHKRRRAGGENRKEGEE